MENSTMKLFALCALALLAVSGIASALSSYDQPCTGDADCWSPLVCDVAAGKCTQPTDVCTNMPAAWTPKLSVPGESNNSTNITTYVSMLENGTWVLTNQSSGTGVYQVGWFSDWQLLSLIGVALAIAVIAIAAMVGHGFNLPEVKAFVDSEMMQAVVSVLLVVSLIGLVTFFDGVARLAVSNGGLPVSCNANEPCYITAARQYLDNTYDAANAAAEDSLKTSFDNQALATTGYSVQFNLWYLAFAGTSWRYNAGWSIEAERGSAVFETLGTLMAALYAQKYFIDVIVFGIAPIFLLLGVLLRTFFFTRKLGGLLLAIAIALFIVYPLTFAFAWYTLNVTVYGSRVLPSSDSSCPAECTATYPVAFYVNSSGGLMQFRTTQEMLLAGINDSNWESGGPDSAYPGLVACSDLSAANINVGPGNPSWGNCENCPDYCREVPFPSSLPGCNVAQCAPCNAGCKIMRQRFDQGQQSYGCSIADCDLATCPSECKLQLPVENKCYYPEGSKPGAALPATQPVPANLAATCGGCSGCPAWCMVLYNNGTDNMLLNKDQKPCQVPACQPASQGGSCPDTCMYISSMPSTSTSCDSICSDSAGNVCPKYCRVTGVPDATDYDTTGILPPECTGSGAYAAACANCKSVCEINLTSTDQSSGYLANCAPFPKVSGTAYNCASCPDYCRFTQFSNYSAYGSNTQLMTGTGSAVFPQVCSQLALPDFDCEPTSCNGTCMASSTPALCREFDQSSSLGGYCTLCPDNTRVDLSYTDSGGQTTTGSALLASPLTCDDANCSTGCKQVSQSDQSTTFNLPDQESNPQCADYHPSYSATPTKCELCQPFCRINGMDESLRDPTCNSATLTRTLSCSLASGADCTSANFANGVCCGQSLQCNQPTGPQLATAVNSTQIVFPARGASPTLAGYTNQFEVTSGSCQSYPPESGTILNGTGTEIGTYSSTINLHNYCTYGQGGYGTVSVDFDPTAVASVNSARLAYQEANDESTINLNSNWWNCNWPTCAGQIAPCSYGSTGPELDGSGMSRSLTYEYEDLGSSGGCGGNGGYFKVQLYVNYTPVCSTDGMACSSGGDCCSGNCNSGQCVPNTGEYSVNLDPRYYTSAGYLWNISFSAQLDPSESVTWQSGGYEGNVAEGGTGLDPSKLSNPMIVTVSSNGTNSQINGVTISYYLNQPVPVCTACSTTLSQGDSCGDSNAGCCGSGLVCDSTTRTCQKQMESIDPCSSQATGPMGTTYCPSTCQYQATQGIICSEYVGAGPGANATDTPINDRVSPYDDRSSCRQCPENCRISYRDGTYYNGSCGVAGNDNSTDANIFVDCSIGSCPAQCRQTVQTPTDGTSCGTDQLSQKPGVGCSALCRRSSDVASEIPADQMSSETSGYCPSLYCGPFNDTTGFGLTDSCLLPDPPAVACEGCLGCPSDCLYTPPVRTDCSDVCSDEALAGPVDIGPTDFIQKLPGATGEADVKNAGTLMIPALVLPLFCLVMVIALIRVLSPILGGDMEIPGLGRII